MEICIGRAGVAPASSPDGFAKHQTRQPTDLPTRPGLNEYAATWACYYYSTNQTSIRRASITRGPRELGLMGAHRREELYCIASRPIPYGQLAECLSIGPSKRIGKGGDVVLAAMVKLSDGRSSQRSHTLMNYLELVEATFCQRGFVVPRLRSQRIYTNIKSDVERKERHVRLLGSLKFAGSTADRYVCLSMGLMKLVTGTAFRPF